MDNTLIQAVEFYDFLTGKASTAIARRLQRNFKEKGIEITAEQWSVLYYLWGEEGLTQQELATRTFRDKPSITRLIDNLERDNLVVRVPDKHDRRVNLIYLSNAGKELQKTCMEQANKTLSEAIKGIDETHIRLAKETLKAVFDNLK